MAGQNLLEFNAANFDEQVLKSPTPVLVDFWAEWCPPCKHLTPTMEKIATDYLQKVRVGKVDVDSNQSIAGKYNVSSIPTVILFKNGQVANMFVGLRKEHEVKAWLDSSL